MNNVAMAVRIHNMGEHKTLSYDIVYSKMIIPYRFWEINQVCESEREWPAQWVHIVTNFE